MKFAHIADCHIGAWRDPRLRDLNSKAFQKAVDVCIEQQVDFVLLAGDLFNTSLPAIDGLKIAVTSLKTLKQKGIPVYIIPGSHDFSPSGKTMLDVLEEAELAVNVVKGSVEDNQLKLQFTTDQKTGAKITGMLGKRGMLEKSYYQNIDPKPLEKEEGFKIFMFHTALTELKPRSLEKMESSPVSMLPKGFDYYAGGHVHLAKESSLEEYKKIIYPGPLFPNNFREMEELRGGGFYIYQDGKLSYQPIQVVNILPIKVDCHHKAPEQVEQELREQIKDKEFINTIVTIRLGGTLKSGKVSDLHLREIFNELYDKSAFFVMKNTAGLSTREFEEVKVKHHSAAQIEEELIKEHLGQDKSGLPQEEQKQLVQSLIQTLNMEKQEGERNFDFESRLKSAAVNALKLNQEFDSKNKRKA